MLRFVTRKVAHAVAVLLIVSFGLAFLIEATPGDPALAVLDASASQEQIDAVREELHLDDSVPSRYWRWISGVAQGDFGTSYRSKAPVLDGIMNSLPVTVEVSLLGLLLGYLIAVPLAIIAAHRVGGRLDRLLSVGSSIPQAIPAFVVALVLVYLFAVKLRDFPVNFPATGWVPLTEDPLGNLRHVALPAITLGVGQAVGDFRILRADMIATLQEDYILAARARGVPPWRILLRHALRPSSFQLVTLLGLSLGRLISGTVVLEQLFALPGIGRFILRSIEIKDVPSVQGVVMFVAIWYVVINVVVDVAYRYLDPRVRAAGAS